MSVSVKIAVRRQLAVKAAPDQTFALLADVPRSVSHFPRVRQLVALGGGAYRWEMEPMGTAGISHQVVYACTYSADAAGRQVRWTPLPEVGNGRIRGRWSLQPSPAGTAIDFETDGHLEVPVPRLLKSVAEPFVLAEFARSIDAYLDALAKSLGGRV